MSADTLTATSRAFYEQTKVKVAVSIFLSAMAMMSLAYVSTYGGESNSAAFLRKTVDNLADDYRYEAQNALAGGYG